MLLRLELIEYEKKHVRCVGVYLLLLLLLLLASAAGASASGASALFVGPEKVEKLQL